jgi:hypothetical protein
MTKYSHKYCNNSFFLPQMLLQEMWCNLIDSGETHPDQEDGALGELDPNAAETDVSEQNLAHAQDEWRKLFPGTEVPRTGRPILPVRDAIGNDSWGDICQEKAGHIFRLYAQNVNGIPLDRRGGQFDTLYQAQ